MGINGPGFAHDDIGPASGFITAAEYQNSGYSIYHEASMKEVGHGNWDQNAKTRVRSRPPTPHFVPLGQKTLSRNDFDHAIESDGETKVHSRRPTPRFVPVRQMALNSNDFDHAIESEEEKPLQTGLPQNDPRSYLMRRKYSEGAKTPSKRKRVNDAMMPLNGPYPGEETRHLVLQVTNPQDVLCDQESQAAEVDPYILSGVLEEAFKVGLEEDETTRITQRVKTLLICQEGIPHDLLDVEKNVLRSLISHMA